MDYCLISHIKDSWSYIDGVITWKRKPRSAFKIGDPVAFTVKPSGHMVLSLTEKGKRKSHKLQYGRAVWLLVNGQWPDGEIDHIDGNPANNLIENLRLSNRASNNWNKSRDYDYAVSKHGASWRVRLEKHGKRYIAGKFKTKEDAIEFRDFAVEELFGEFKPRIANIGAA